MFFLKKKKHPFASDDPTKLNNNYVFLYPDSSYGKNLIEYIKKNKLIFLFLKMKKKRIFSLN